MHAPERDPEKRRALWADLRQFVERFARDGATGAETCFVKRRDEASPELVPHLDTCATWLRSAEPPPDFTNVDALRVLLAAIPDAEAPLWSLLEPAVYADAVLGSTKLMTRWEWNLPAGYVIQVDTGTAGTKSSWSLKTRLTEADAETIAACKDVAKRHWESGGLGTKMSVAYAFQDEDAWRREAIDLFLANQNGMPSWIVSSMVRDVDQATALIEKCYSLDYEAIARNVGPGIAPALAAQLGRSRYAGEALVRAVAVVDSPESAVALAGCLGKPYLKALAAPYFEKGSEHAKSALRNLAEGNSHTARIAEDMLDRLERRGADAASLSIIDATPEEVPAVLRDPPWRKPLGERGPRLAPIKGVLIPEAKNVQERVIVSEEDASLGKQALLEKLGGTIPSTNDLRTEWEKSSAPFEYLSAAYPFVLKTLGNDGIAGALPIVERFPELALSIDSPRVAPIIASRTPGACAPWIQRYPKAAVIGLIPYLQDPIPWRVFGWMVRREIIGRDEISALVKDHYPGHEKEIEERIEHVLKNDPPEVYPEAVPKLEGVVVDMLDRPLLRTRKRLPLDAFRALLELLSFNPTPFSTPSMEAVRAAFSPQSLASLAWDLACIWETRQRGTGRRRYASYDQYRWMLNSVVTLGDDDVTRRLTPRMSGVAIIEVLGWIATDAAVLELLTIYAREMASKGKKLLSTVEHHLRMAAGMRGLTSDELEETILPDPEKAGAVLKDGKTLVLDYGPRQFELRWSEDLRPCLVIEKGAIVKRMPAVRQTDDKDLVEKAKEAWATITEDVGALVVRRVELLRRRRDAKRSFTLAELRAHYIDPPLLAALARGLLFVRTAEPSKAFRVAEDRTFADVNDGPVVIENGEEEIRLACFDDLSAEDRDAWRTLFLDYEIITPLPQLDDPNAPPAA